MPTVLFTPIANDDLVEIWAFIAAGSDDETADEFVDRIAEKCRLIAISPLAFPTREELLPAVRMFAFERYVIFYLPNIGGIEVLRVLHSARDIDALFETDDRT